MNKKIIISSVAVFSAVALAGCGGDLAQQAQDDVAKTNQEAQESVQQANEDFVATKQEVKEIKDEAMQDVKDSTTEIVADATKDVVDTTTDQVKQDAEALEAVAKAAGAKYTAVILTTYKNDAAASVSPSSYANSIDSSSKNGASFVVEVVNQDGTTSDVYLDANGKVLFTETK